MRQIARRAVGLLGILAAVSLILAVVGLAQPNADVRGAWKWVSVEISSSDGNKSEPMGPSPLGHLVFDRSGHFAYLLARKDLPRFAGSSREDGTAEENRAAMRGTLAMSGTYTVAGNVLTFKIEASSYPNLVGTDRKVTILSLTESELRYSNPTPSNAGGGTAIAVARRVN